MITILDYGLGNVASISNMLKSCGVKSYITSEPKAINDAEKIILPGVGSFDYGMHQLNKLGFVELLNHRVLKDKTPILGICLGAQLLTSRSDEGKSNGLGWICADTQRFDQSRIDCNLRIPHMGWSSVSPSESSRLFEGLRKVNRFYFVHSYHIVCSDRKDEIASCHYGYDFTCAVEKDNVIGVQFHPEKSHKFGKQILKNYADNY